MPTGYTAPIIESKKPITLRQYALRCARAFGACLNMRDDDMDLPPPQSLQPDEDSYHVESLAKAHSTIKRLSRMTKAQKKAYNIKRRKAQLRSLTKGKVRADVERARYAAMRNEVQAWDAPAELANLKEFMLSQIEVSASDRMTDYYANEIAKLGKVDYYRNDLDGAIRDIEYHTEKIAKERQGIEQANQWLATLHKAFPNQSA